MPDLDTVDLEGTGRGDTILVSLPPPEGSVVASALRAQGFVVTEAPLHLLAVRALAEIPRVMIVDVDAPGAVEAIDRTQEVTKADLVCVGDPTRAAELGALKADGRAFERPLDVDALVTSVIGGAEPKGPPRSRGTAPPSVARSRETSPPRSLGGEALPSSGYPSTGDPLDVGGLLPTLDEEEGTAIFAPVAISLELSHILDSAERRVSALGRPHPSTFPSPEEELDLLLPPDLLAALDEPLEPDDDGSPSGSSTGGTFPPKPRTSGETGASTGAVIDKITGEPTAPGRASTHPTVTGTGSLAGVTPPFGPSPAWAAAHLSDPPPGPQPRPPVEPLPSETPGSSWAPLSPSRELEAALAMELRPLRIGVVPIPIESLPDRPVPDPSVLLSGRESPKPLAVPYLPPQVPIPAVLGDGEAVRALSAAIAGRVSGSLALGPEATTRRVVLHEGDIVTAASSSADETLIAFLAARGDLERSEVARLQGRLPAHGRHAGAALIAHGHLGQDDLWPVLRAHAEWIIGRVLLGDEGTCELEAEAPGRLKAEPSVFGGATGAEVLLEEIRRVIPPEVARRRLGGATARLAEGPRRQLLVECALRPEEEQIVRSAAGRSVGEVLAEAEPELADVLYGLVSLGVLEALAPTAKAEAAPPAADPLDEEALRQRVRARVALVEDGDYFSLLGIARGATGYEIRRAYLELRRAFEPGRVLTAATADLAADVRLVAEVLDEAYEILREPHRRERYRRAIEAGPP